LGQVKVTVNYKLPLPDNNKDELALSVLPIDTLGGAGEARTLDLLTEKSMILSGGCCQREGGEVPG